MMDALQGSRILNRHKNTTLVRKQMQKFGEAQVRQILAHSLTLYKVI